MAYARRRPAELPEDAEPWWRRDRVEIETGLSCSAIYRRMSAGTFPRGHLTDSNMKNSPRRWAASEIRAWKAGAWAPEPPG